MATAELVVAFGAKIDGLEASLKRVTTQLNQLETSAQQSQRGMQQSIDGMSSAWGRAAESVKGFVLAYGTLKGFELLKQGVLAVDDLNASINRLKALTGQTGPATEDQFRRIADIAAKAGQPVAELTDQFQRFYVATASIGTTSATVDRLVETLAGFARLSGKGPQEAGAAITQLAQGLASGKLQGDELKSILENMPLLAQSLAKELGVSVGELRKMGEEGKLTADVVLPALLASGEKIKKLLEDLPLTIRQSFQVTSDRFVALIREIDKQVGASSGIASLLQAMGMTAESIRVRVAGVGQDAAPADRLANLTRQAGEATRSLEQVDAALAAITSGSRPNLGNRPGQNPLSGLSAQELDKIRATQLDRIRSFNAQIAEVQGQQDMATASDERKRVREAAETQAGGLATLQRQLADSVNPRLAVERTYTEQMEKIRRGEIAGISLGGRDALRAQEQAAQARIDAAKERQEALDKIAKKEAGPAGPRDRSAEDRDKEIKAELDRQRAALAAANQLVTAAADPIRSLRLQFEQFSDASGQAGSVYGNFAQRVVKDNEDMAIGFQAIIEKSKVAGQALIGMGQAPLPAIQSMRDEFERFRLILERAGADPEAIALALEEAGRRGEEAFAKLANKTDNSFRDIEKSIVQSFSRGVADSLVDFATGAEKNFAQVAADFAKMVAKMILNWLIFRAITAGLKEFNIDLGGATGRSYNPDATGATSAVSRADPFASVDSPYFTGGRPLIPAVSSASRDVTVNVMNNAPGATARQQERSDGAGGTTIDVYIEEVVRSGMASGRFDGVMGATFGAGRIGRV